MRGPQLLETGSSVEMYSHEHNALIASQFLMEKKHSVAINQGEIKVAVKMQLIKARFVVD